MLVIKNVWKPHQKCSSSRMLVIKNVRTPHQKCWSSKMLLIKNVRHQECWSSKMFLIKNVGHQKCSSSKMFELLIENVRYQKCSNSSTKMFELLIKNVWTPYQGTSPVLGYVMSYWFVTRWKLLTRTTTKDVNLNALIMLIEKNHINSMLQH